MFKSATVSALLCLLIAPQAGAAEIIELTQYHNEELKVPSGQMWLGLFPAKAGQYELRATKVAITLVNDPIGDQSPKEKTGKKVSIAGKQEPFVLMRGITGLKEGKVVTSSTNKKEHLDINEMLKFKVGTSETTLRVTGSPTKLDGEDFRADYAIVLDGGGIKQTLFQSKQVSPQYAPSLLWAGDLDGDGKIDLIMDTSTDYNARILTLFLSTKAKAGNLVEEVASRLSTGC